ncbi:hypothetical protein ABZZ20_09495 [Streptomyces sp. NPDC006430]|uniref:hypothetical protein n=1 Tax=Streptomyces sp. NPDC006430 TaxID=3154299 RepID=UPI0033AF6FC3
MPRSPRTAAAVLLAMTLCGGCAAGTSAGTAAGPGGPVPSSSARPAPLQEIAEALGCTPEITVDAEELREGACGSGQEGFRMATFTTEQGRQAWLTEAQMYGGTYLVGPRWVITAASAEALAPARTRLGGTIESAPAHGSPSQGSSHGSDGGPDQGASHGASHGAAHPGGHDTPSPATS